MNEKNLKVLEQYELEVRSTRRGRDCYILDTTCGMVLLKEYQGSEVRASGMEKVCRKVIESGMRADCPLANRDGNYVSADREQNRYILKLWTPAREMDVKNTEEIYEAADNLAKLHKVLTGLECEEVRPREEQRFEKRRRELRKIYRYMKEKKRKNPFEIQFMQEYSRYMEQCDEACELAEKENIVALAQASRERGRVCHGDYNQHNVLKDGGNFVTVNFERCAMGIQMDDLYCFMRKMLEKHNWNPELARGMLNTYKNICSVNEDELEELYLQFLFPEKFWKIANHYYNSKKTWIPDRSLQKLNKMVQQAQARQQFLVCFKEICFS